MRRCDFIELEEASQLEAGLLHGGQATLLAVDDRHDALDHVTRFPQLFDGFQ